MQTMPIPPGFANLSPTDSTVPILDDLDPAVLEEFRTFLGIGTHNSTAESNPWKSRGLINDSKATVEITSWKASKVGERAASSLLDKEANFEDFNLSEDLLKGIRAMGFVKPSKIQVGALPAILCKPDGRKGNNLIGQAQNGSGKTAAFALAILHMLDISIEWPQALVLCPTRELARQNNAVIAGLGKFLPVKTLLLVPSQDRISKNTGAHVLIGTPGKTLDLAKKRVCDLSGVKVLVLDEADIMLDTENMMGPQVTQIRQFLPDQDNVQVLFFSATYPDEVRDFAESQVPHPISIKLKKTDLTLSSVKQMYVSCDNDWDKFDKLQYLYACMNVGQSVVFVNTRRKAFDLAKWMKDKGFSVSLICGTQTTGEERMDPALRDQVMDEFRRGVTRVLIATDVLSRGIDVPQVTLVINYELPVNYHSGDVDMETYIHRVGRTGRFGLKGVSVNLVSHTEHKLTENICAFFECAIAEMDSDFDALEKQLQKLR